MNNVTEIILLVFATAVVVLSLPALRGYAVQLARRTEAREHFFEAAHRVLETPDLPKEMFARLAFYTVTITWTLPTRMLLWDIVTLRFRKSTRASESVHALLQKLPPKAREEYARAVICYFRAVTFNNPITGEIVRQIVGSTLKKDYERADEAAQMLRQQIGAHTAHDDACAAPLAA